MSRVIVVTGTDTGVGKTIATAALAVRATDRGTVTVVKPTQTGVGDTTASRDTGPPPEAWSPAEPSDADEIHRLSGCAVREFTRLPDPLAPDSAARLRDVRIPTVGEHAERVRTITADTVLVEGAGGLLVRLDTEGGTILDLAVELGAEVYVVCRAGLGTLNHTELTVGALRGRGIEPAGLIIGAWPATPGLAETCNRADLPRVTGVRMDSVIPSGAGMLDGNAFQRAARSWALHDERQANRSVLPAVR
ncbi:dethiobiotin synthase [Nocardioides sp. JQ2195]|uniref:dethiobiotin synthase n=1 Tax=Nocardioides sp. JQ2195 TaxID=2592334 RepID=UPI00143E3C94|nr:dethiobiotin synthase [Nocardioides sp. JQ2195]QIX26147.1 dethiobiotin synthase [Nocardioides sp. JQ2195]